MPKIKIGPKTLWPSTIGFLVLAGVLTALDFFVRWQSYNKLKIQTGNSSDLKFDTIVVPSLQLVPNQFFYFPWTLFTEPFVEVNFVTLNIWATVLYYGVEYLEDNWNPEAQGGAGAGCGTEGVYTEAVNYITLMTLITTSISVVLVTAGAVTGLSDPATLGLPVRWGICSILMSFVVVVKQLSPEYNVRLFKVVKFRLKRLPFIILSAALVYSVAVNRSASPFFTPLFVNFYASWVYLRYYQIHNAAGVLPASGSTGPSQTVRGDASDTFAFIQFFPDSWQQYLRPVSKFVYHTSAFLGLFRPFNDDDIESSNLRTMKRLNASTGSTNGSSDADTDADRRKKVALKVLEQSSGSPNPA